MMSGRDLEMLLKMFRKQETLIMNRTLVAY